MKRTLLLAFIAMLSLTFSCKKDSKQESHRLQVYIKPNSTGNTAYYVLVSMDITNQNGQKVVYFKDLKPSPYPFNSDTEVKSGDVLTVKYSGSHDDSYIDFEVRWGEKLLYSSYNHNLQGKTGNTITVKAP